MTFKLLLVLSLAMIVSYGCGTSRTYVVVDKANDAQLLWNEREAFLFVSASQIGYSATPFEQAKERICYLLRTVCLEASGTRSRVTVFHYDANGLDTRVLETKLGGRYHAFDGHIYGSGVRWNGREFEPLKADERERYLSSLNSYDSSASIHDGWRDQSALLSTSKPEQVFQMHVAGQDIIITIKQHWPVDATIDFQRGTQPTQRIWSFDGNPKRVSEQEYQRIFGAK